MPWTQEEHHFHLPNVSEGQGYEHRGKLRDTITALKSNPLIKEAASFLWAPECLLLQDCSNHLLNLLYLEGPVCFYYSLGQSSSHHLGCGVNGSAVETCQ